MERKQIPMPLQKQILIHVVLAVLLVVAGMSALVFVSGTAAVPFLLLAVLAAMNGWRIYHVAAHGRYLILSATVLKVERTAVLRRPKAVLIEAEGKAMRVVLRSRYKIPAEGGSITFYIQDSTPIYEWRGLRLLSSYLAYFP